MTTIHNDAPFIARPIGPVEPRPPMSVPASEPTGSDSVVRHPEAGDTPPFSEQTRLQARRAHASGHTPADDAYVRHMRMVRRALQRLGVSLDGGRAHLHVTDIDRTHGEQVLRSAVSPVGLADLRWATLDLDGPVRAFGERVDFDRWEVLLDRLQAGVASPAEAAEVVELNEAMAVEQLMLRLIEVVADLPEGVTVVNASWGSDRFRGLQIAARAVLDAPADSPWGAAMRAAPGPTAERRALNALHRATRDSRSFGHLDGARRRLSDLLERFRDRMLVVVSAGNHLDDAQTLGDPQLSRGSSMGVERLVRVGAADGAHGRGMARFSSVGDVDVAAMGVLPTGAGGRRVHGTSYAAPQVAAIAWAMAHANPALTAEQIGELLTDPRVTVDVPHTDRDGAGWLDPFAAVLLARHPGATRRQIRAAWRVATADPIDREAMARIIERLGPGGR